MSIYSNARKTFPASVLYSWLEDYRIDHELRQWEISEKLGWKSQFYGGLRRKKTVNIRTVLHVGEKLGVDPDDILFLVDGTERAIGEILRQYPKEVVRWMATDEGREVIVKAYTSKIISEAKRELKNKVNYVAQEVMNAC